MVGFLDEFTELYRYAPDDTDTEAKKIECFMNGLHDEMQCVLVTHDFIDLESLADKAIQLEIKRKSMFEGRKRRMNTQEGSSSQKPRTFSSAPKPAYRPPQQPSYAPRP